jgi:hypothetical protein
MERRVLLLVLAIIGVFILVAFAALNQPETPDTTTSAPQQQDILPQPPQPDDDITPDSKTGQTAAADNGPKESEDARANEGAGIEDIETVSPQEENTAPNETQKPSQGTGEEPSSEETQATEISAEPGLLLYYKFEEDGGRIAADSSGNENEGRIKGAHSVSGKSGLALFFEGSLVAKDVVYIKDSEEFNITDSVTAMAWVKANADPAMRRVVGKGDSWDLEFSSSGALRFGGEFVGEVRSIFAQAEPIAQNRWVHVAGTYDGESLRVFVNGNEVAENEIEGEFEKNRYPAAVGSNRGANRFWQGSIDEVRIYDYSLSSEEIKRAMDNF